jgi:hypothetical protein
MSHERLTLMNPKYSRCELKQRVELGLRKPRVVGRLDGRRAAQPEAAAAMTALANLTRIRPVLPPDSIRHP